MAELCGYTKEEVIRNMILADFFSANIRTQFEKALVSEESGGRNRLLLFETTVNSKNGREVPVQISATTIEVDGRRSGIVCFFRDLRKIRELEREMADQAHILHQDKMMSLGRLAASVVHEINNPLAGVLNYLRLMQRIIAKETVDEERLKEFTRFLELVESETDRCSKIVASLLRFARMESPRFGTVSIEELIDRSVLLCQHKLELTNIELELDLRRGLPAVAGDFNQLQQCFFNLIFNAIDAMPEGGVLKVACRYDADRCIVSIRFKDSGCGIAPDDLAHIFEPFYTTKSMGHGVGLGLSTVYGIVKQHNGAINAQSVPGQGAEFTIELPIGNNQPSSGS
jgi:PAS domain S-box-containing protein